MDDQGLIVATDVRGRRVDLLAQDRARLGCRVGEDRSGRRLRSAARRRRSTGSCSMSRARGSARIRRDPDVRWRRSEADLPRLAAAQRQMLEETARGAAAGRPARLLDVLERARGERGRRRGIRRRAAPSGPCRRAICHAPVQPLVNPAGHLRTFPFRDGLEAFFGAVLTRADGPIKSNLRYNLRLHATDDARVGSRQGALPVRRAAPDLRPVRGGGDADGPEDPRGRRA